MERAAANKFVPSAILLLTLLLAAFYVAVFRPLRSRAATLDAPLQALWQEYLATNRACAACVGLGPEFLGERRAQLTAAATNLAATVQWARGRMALPDPIRDVMDEPFRLIEFLNERQNLGEQLGRLAKQKGVTLAPGALGGLPEYSIDLPEPALLWPRLYMATQLLLTAIHCQVGTVSALTQLPAETHRSAAGGVGFLEAMPMRLELVGPAEALHRFLMSLPGRGPELAGVALDQVLTNKPAFYFEQFLLRKSAPTRPQEGQLEVTVRGFVPWVAEHIRQPNLEP
ncbi:MAG: hypothetical protein FJ387_08780 [Verrucomicrobia bacterium]|nr:hypothetical protein [Verrucomicrobiota bacterium]